MTDLGGPDNPDPASPYIRDRLRTVADALKVNQAVADVLDPVASRLSYRVRRCDPRYRCTLSRVCANCGRARQVKVARTHASRLGHHLGHCVHVVLTTRAIEHLTTNAVRRVQRAFLVLRKTARFRRAVAGGVSCVQVVHGQGWLIHIDAVIVLRDNSEGKEFSRRWLRDAWRGLTGASRVWTTAIDRGTERRVMAYGARWQGLPTNRDLLGQYLYAMHGLTLVRDWGVLSGNTRRPPQQAGS